MDGSGKLLLGFGALMVAAAFMPSQPRDLLLAAMKGAIQGFTERLPASTGRNDDRCAGAETHWKSVETINRLESYEEHLARFPNCSFAGLANQRIKALKEEDNRSTIYRKNDQCQGQPKHVPFTCINPATGKPTQNCICS